MRRTPFPLPHRLALAAAALGGLLSALPGAARAQGAVGADAVAACERAARQSVAPRAGGAEVSFTAPPAAQPGLSHAGQAVLRGAGRWRSAGGVRSFSYSCNVDLRTGDAVGVVVRHAEPDAAATASPARAAAEPDLGQLSPAACESSAAVALKQRWPRVSHISFESDTRRLASDPAGTTELQGRGQALPAPDAPSTYFGFSCVVDPKDGRVLSTRISG